MRQIDNIRIGTNIRKYKKLKRDLLSSTQKYQSLDLGEIDGSGLANLLKNSWGQKNFKLELDAENWGVLYCRIAENK